MVSSSSAAAYVPSKLELNFQKRQQSTEAEKMARTLFGEIPSSCSLTLLLGPAWVPGSFLNMALYSY